MKNDPLPEKYRKALSLIEEGNLSYKEISKVCGIPSAIFYDLIEGNAKNYGTIGEKFTAALTEIQKRRDKEIRDLVKKCKKKTFYLIDTYLANHKTVTKKDKSLVASLVSIANALSKSTPNVEIGSFSYTKGLSAEDLINEFKRLRGLTSDRRGVSASKQGGTGEIPVSLEPGSGASEESEDIIL